MTPEELQELCALYVLGALEPQEAALIEARLQANDPEVTQEITSLREVTTLLPHALTPVPPSPTVRAQLMARIQASRHEAPRQQSMLVSRGFFGWLRLPQVWVPTVATALLVLVMGWIIHGLRSQVAALKADVQHLRAAASERERLVALLTAPQVTLVPLGGTAHAPHAGAHVLWDTANQTFTVVTYGLPPLPSGKVYQLWGLTAQQPLPFNTFRVDRHGVGSAWTTLSGRQATLAGFAVSLEPEGGVAQPTGDIVLLATF